MTVDDRPGTSIFSHKLDSHVLQHFTPGRGSRICARTPVSAARRHGGRRVACRGVPVASWRISVGDLQVLQRRRSAGQVVLPGARGSGPSPALPGRSLWGRGGLVRSAAACPPVSRLRRRGAFGLDERRWPDPERVDAQVRAWLGHTFPEIWVLPDRDGADASGRSLALLLPQGSGGDAAHRTSA